MYTALTLVISLLLIATVANIDVILDKKTNISSRILTDIRVFKGVATATVGFFAFLWLSEQSFPSYVYNVTNQIVQFFPEAIVDQHTRILVTLLIGWWVVLANREGDKMLERWIANRYSETLAPIAENVWDIAVIALYVLIVFNIWGISIITLVAPAGVIGIVFGFAARETISNFFGSISLYADETYESGDYIELENGMSGVVRDITVRSTSLQTLDGNIINIPNSELNESKIKNESSPTGNRRIRAQIEVPYGSDLDEVTEVLSNAAEDLSETREPEVFLSSFNGSGIEFEVCIWTTSPEKFYQHKDELNRSIYNALEDNGIGIPYPHRKVV